MWVEYAYISFLWNHTGIGRASTLLFASEGAQVIATDMNVDNLKDVANIPGVIRTEKLNVAVKEDIQKLAESIEKIDIIFNCAG